jgi:hypothetical protein
MTVTTPAGPARSEAWPSVAGLGLPATAGVAATAVFLLVHDALIDDAYITTGCARNAGLHLISHSADGPGRSVLEPAAAR